MLLMDTHKLVQTIYPISISWGGGGDFVASQNKGRTSVASLYHTCMYMGGGGGGGGGGIGEERKMPDK